MRLRLLVEGARRWADYCDIEAAFYQQAASLSPDLSRVIISHHDFTGTPADLEAIYERLIALPAAVHKIVARANSMSDSLRILGLLERARLDGRSLIALAMGSPGLITRILGPSRGCFLTYCSLGPGRESAPGQITCDELRNLYRVNHLSPRTKITGIIGKPVSHSVSPAMHNAGYRALGLDFIYLPLEVDDVGELFGSFVRRRGDFELDVRGFSVTIPHKTAVLPFLDKIDPIARRIGAVNTVVMENGEVIGYNTDAGGALEPLERACLLKGQECAVIGAGGSARAVVHGLVDRGAGVTVFARDIAKANVLGEEFDVGTAPLASLEDSGAAIIINTTPVGMQGHSEGATPIPRAALRGRRIVYDLVYNPLDTRLLQDARAEGCETISGIEMLVAQAAAQFKLWTGRQPPVDVMRDAALSKLLTAAARP